MYFTAYAVAGADFAAAAFGAAFLRALTAFTGFGDDEGASTTREETNVRRPCWSNVIRV
jgi:hypothetical protein